MRTPLLSGLVLMLALSLFAACSEEAEDPYAKYYSQTEDGPVGVGRDRETAVGDYGGEVLAEAAQPAYEEAEARGGYAAGLEGAAPPAEAEWEKTGPAGDEVESGPTTETETLDLERKLIYETSMTVVVDDLDEGRREVEEIVKANHKEGSTPVFITQQKVNREIGRVGRIHYTIRCHADVRERLVAALREVGEVWAEDSTVEDVTRRYYDLEKQRDLLEADYAIAKAAFAEAQARGARAAELERLKADMERIAEALGEAKGALKGFDDLITLPTIHLTLEEKDPATSYSGWRVVEEGFTVAYKAIVNILKFVIIVVGVGLLVALLFLPSFLLVRWIVRSVKRAQAKE